jgi:DNA-binding NtrC family response regulator
VNVLVVDDQPAIRQALVTLFELHDLPCREAGDAAAAEAAVRSGEIGVVVQDMNFGHGRTDGEEGVALFRRLKAADPELPVLLVTAWTSLETAVQLVKEGAADYLAKPWDDRRLVANVERLLAARRAARRPAPASPREPDLVVSSPALARVVELAKNVAGASVPVLVTGPNGSGKERIADLVHEHSPRRGGPFVKVNAGALPAELLEAELFGAEAGAYTGLKGQRIGRFEAADGGTLFLDEVDALTLAGQVKLLRVLETGEFARLGSSRTQRADVRVISATNADLKKEIAAGRFREDLYFRLNVVEIAVPSLAKRPEDVVPLAEYFLRETGGLHRGLSEAARRALLAHPWPGNVRELRNRIQRASLVAQGEIRPEDLDLGTGSGVLAGADPERNEIELALRDSGGIVAHAAERLGLSRQALYRKMARLGLGVEKKVERT